MPLWWNSSSKGSKRNPNKESFIDAFQRKFSFPSESKPSRKSGAPLRQYSDIVSDRISKSGAESRCPSPSKEVARCQSFVDRPVSQPLPLPGVQLATVGRIDSGILTSERGIDKPSKKSPFVLRARISCIRSKREPIELDGDLVTASVSSECSVDSEDPPDLIQRSPLPSDCDVRTRVTLTSPTSMAAKDQTSALQTRSGDAMKPGNQVLHLSSRRRPLSSRVPNIQVPGQGTFCNAPDSSMSSPSKSPMRVFSYEQVLNTTPLNVKPYRDTQLLGSGQCSSPASGQNSGHNSLGGYMSGQNFWQPSRSSPEYSPVPSPRMTSPGPSSQIHSGAVTPLHPRAGGFAADDGKQQQSHWLPLPPITVGNSSPFSNSNSAAMSPSVPRSPGKAENPITAGPRWKKGKLLGSGTFGHVYVGFSSQSGGMCAMKEVTLFADDAKSKESAKQFGQEIILLSRLKHPNIVQYYGSETLDDKLYIYLEYVSGGSIYKLLQEYGEFGESAIRSYTKQILSGLAYLHSKNTVHRDIKGANILVDPNGHVKLADFGMAKHISGQSCPLSLKGSPYWMAPEVINNSNGCHLAVDIWSLGCTVLEMATTKPPWSHYEGVAAMFKIGNSKELPAIPAHLSDEGKDFVRKCLQRDPLNRPTASQLLGHPFVKYAEKTTRTPGFLDRPAGLTNELKSGNVGQGRSILTSDSERLVSNSSNASKSDYHSSDMNKGKNISSPVSPIGSPLLYPRSPQHMSGKISAVSSPHTKSGSSSPLTAADVGVIPFHLHKKSVYFQNGFQPNPSQATSYLNAAVSPNHDILKGVQSGTTTTTTSPFNQLLSSEREANRRFLEGEVCNSQSALADRVSRQLLKGRVKLSPSLDLSPP